jgi:L-asparagine transporter-like permease
MLWGSQPWGLEKVSDHVSWKGIGMRILRTYICVLTLALPPGVVFRVLVTVRTLLLCFGLLSPHFCNGDIGAYNLRNPADS